MDMKRSILAISLALGAALLATPGVPPAEACGNPVVFATDKTVRALKQADEKLNAGNPAEAAAIVEKTIKNIHFGMVATGSKRKEDALLNRGLRIMALASLRQDGEYGFFGKVRSPEQRKVNVGWATNILKALTAVKPDDPA